MRIYANLNKIIYLSWHECSYNALINLDVSNNPALLELKLENMPSLYEVCVWEMPFPPDGFNLNTNGSPNMYFTTECD
jgi:hypothetical protein